MGLRLAGLPIRTIGYVEIDEYCQKLLQARIRDGFLDWAPIIRDVRRADFGRLAGLVDLITAGFPCQPHSAAGLRAGAADERNLWPATIGAIRHVGPRWVLLENVPGILANGYAGTVVGELAALGYDSIGDRVPATAVGAPHLRWRWFCLSHADGDGRAGRRQSAEQGRQRHEVGAGQVVGADGDERDAADPTGIGRGERRQPSERRFDGGGETLAHTDSQRQQQQSGAVGQERERPGDGGENVGDSPGSRHQTGEPGESGQTERPEEPERRSRLVPDPCGLGRRPEGRFLSEREPDSHWSRGQPSTNTHGARLESDWPLPDGPEVSGSRGHGEVPYSNDPGHGVPRAGGGEQEQPRPVVRDPISDDQGEQMGPAGQSWEGAGGIGWWDVEPALGRVVDGHPHRVDQVRALGNGIVPAVVAEFLRGRR